MNNVSCISLLLIIQLVSIITSFNCFFHLLGELTVAEANSVLMFAPLTDGNQGKTGLLVVTNFKVTFITSDTKDSSCVSALYR